MFVAGMLVLLLGVCASAASARPVLGTFDLSTPAQMSSWKSDGGTAVIIPVYWDQAQPTALGPVSLAAAGDGGDNVLTEIQDAYADGLQVYLELDLQYPPGWVTSGVPEFVDQFGEDYSSTTPGANIRDWIWSEVGRQDVASFVNGAMADLAPVLSDVAGFRSGGGVYGELDFPPVAGADASQDGVPSAWAYDAPARTGSGLAVGESASPLPNYVYGSGTAAENTEWANWYLGSLGTWIQWYTQLLQSDGWTGPTYVLEPSFGQRSNWSTTSLAYAQQLAYGTDYGTMMNYYDQVPNVWPWSTWADDSEPYWTPGDTVDSDAASWRKLLEEAQSHGLASHIMGENSGGGGAASVDQLMSGALAAGFTGVFYLDYPYLTANSLISTLISAFDQYATTATAPTTTTTTTTPTATTTTTTTPAATTTTPAATTTTPAATTTTPTATTPTATTTTPTATTTTPAATTTTTTPTTTTTTTGVTGADPDSLSVALSTTSPRVATPVTLTFTSQASPIGSTGDGPYLYTVLQPAGAGACQATYGMDLKVVGTQAIALTAAANAEVKTGQDSHAYSYTSYAPGTYTVCGWLETDSKDSSAASDTASVVTATTSANLTVVRLITGLLALATSTPAAKAAGTTPADTITATAATVIPVPRLSASSLTGLSVGQPRLAFSSVAGAGILKSITVTLPAGVSARSNALLARYVTVTSGGKSVHYRVVRAGRALVISFRASVRSVTVVIGAKALTESASLKKAVRAHRTTKLGVRFTLTNTSGGAQESTTNLRV